MNKEIIIDASKKKLGRLASDIALSLRGKKDASFLPYEVNLPKVIVKNVDKISFSEKKLKEQFFIRYSGYPGGQKLKRASDVAAVDKRDVLLHAVSGMIHANKLKQRMIKNLVMYHGEEK